MTDQSPFVAVSREIAASPDTVWEILTTAAGFSEWMDGIVTFEPEVGSPFRAEFPAYQMAIVGEVVALDHTKRTLSLTWGVESGPGADSLPAGSTLVSFTVSAADSGCLVAIEHGQLPNELAADQQRQGWAFHLSRMELRANRADLTTGLAATLPHWFAAWNDTDEDSRMKSLVACCAQDVTFQDDWTTLSGLELLTLHIENCFRFVPGWRLEHTGETLVCRGQALVGWRSVGPDGASMEGYNHVIADPHGRIRSVSGFQRGG